MSGRGTTLRNVRVAEDIWRPALARAHAEGTNLSAKIVEWLTAYGNGEDTPQPAPPR